MLDFATRLRALAHRLQADSEHVVLDFEINPSIDESIVDEVVERIGFKLDDRFLDYFRSCNGARLAWASRSVLGEASTREAQLEAFDEAAGRAYDVGVEHVGSIEISPLETLVDGDLLGDTFGISGEEPGAYIEPTLGGMDSHELRCALRWLDREYLRDDLGSSNNQTALVLHPRFPDPVVIFAQDYAAGLSSGHPMLARHYLELMLAAGGGLSNRRRFYRLEGSEGNHALTSFRPQPLLDYPYLTPGHTEALQALALETGLQVRDVSSKVQSLQADQQRYQEVFETFGVRYQTTDIDQPGYANFRLPGDIENLIALEYACLDLGTEKDLADVSFAYRDKPEFGPSFSYGSLSVDLEVPENVDTRESILFYRLSELPKSWLSGIPNDHPVRDCLFFVAPAESTITQTMFELEEPPMSDITAAMALASTIDLATGLSRTLVHLIGTKRSYGFHTAPYNQVEDILQHLSFHRLSIDILLCETELYEVTDASGAAATGALDRIFSRGQQPAKSRGVRRELRPGMYILDRLPFYDKFVLSQGRQKAVLSRKALPAPGEVKRLQLKE